MYLLVHDLPPLLTKNGQNYLWPTKRGHFGACRQGELSHALTRKARSACPAR
jgi:hypothetical protein